MVVAPLRVTLLYSISHITNSKNNFNQGLVFSGINIITNTSLFFLDILYIIQLHVKRIMLNTYIGGVICVHFPALSQAPAGLGFESGFQTLEGTTVISPPRELNSNKKCSLKVYANNKERRQVLDPQTKEDTKTKPIANNPKDRYKIFT